MTHRKSFEDVALACGYFNMTWQLPYSMMFFDGCVQTGFFDRNLVLSLDSETKADPSKKKMMASSVEMAPGIYRPKETIDWNYIFHGSWSMTAVEQNENWLSEFLEYFTMPLVPTYSTLRYPPFPELIPILRAFPGATLASLCSSRRLTVLRGDAATFEHLVTKAGKKIAAIPDELKAMAIEDYSSVALDCATKFSAQLQFALGSQ